MILDHIAISDKTQKKIPCPPTKVETLKCVARSGSSEIKIKN